MKRCNRPCPDCPFREDSSPDGRALLDDYDPAGSDVSLDEWACHRTLQEWDDDVRLCAGAQIVAGLMSQTGRPVCSLPERQ